jgi:hypothetical protein
MWVASAQAERMSAGDLKGWIVAFTRYEKRRIKLKFTIVTYLQGSKGNSMRRNVYI